MKGNIRLSRVTSNQEPYNYASITIEDEISGIEFLKIDMCFEELGKFVAGTTGEMNFQTRGINNIGKTRETKRETIPIPENFFGQFTDIEAKELIKSYEVDGWVGSTYDLNNQRKTVKENGKTGRLVSFTRYI